MKMLVFTTLFPNSEMPNHGLFVKEKIMMMAQFCELRVIAPVPYFPKLNINNKWFMFSQVPFSEEIDGIKVFHPRYLITPGCLRSLYGFFMFISLFNCVRKLGKNFDFDLIDAHFLYPDGLAAVLIAKAMRKKVVLTARGTDVNWYPQFRIIRSLIQYALRKADLVIAVSKTLKERMLDLGIEKDKIMVIPNGVDQARFFPIERQAARKKLGLPMDEKIILSIGQLRQLKGFHLLIEAMRASAYPNIRLYIIGEGEYRRQLENLILKYTLHKNVILLGQKPQEELINWYSAADIFCLTSLSEGRPNVILESLACGTPVITMNQWELSEFVNQDNGILLEKYVPEDIAKAIENALQKKWEREKIADSVKYCSWDKSAQDTHALFERILAKKDIFFFSSDDWDSGLKTSKYHLALNLSKSNRVIFIESIGLRKPQMGKRDFKKAFRKINKWFKGLRKINENLYIFSPLVIPFHKNTFSKRFNAWFLKMQINHIKRKLCVTNPVYWTFLPNTLELLKGIREKIVYYCVDNMSAFKGVDSVEVKEMDKELTRLSGVVFTVSRPLFEEKKLLNPNTYYMPHGVNYSHFSENHREKPEVFKHIPQPVIGFYGIISPDWIDFELLSFIAESHPEWSIVMIGKIDMNNSLLPKQSNIHYLGPIDYEILPSYAKWFDVAMIPFARNELTNYCNPLKVYEYFALGKPVVSVDIPEIRHLEGMLHIAANKKEFVQKTEQALKGDLQEQKWKRMEFAKNNSWERKTQEVWEIIQKS